MKIAHIINPVKVDESNKSYLFYAQPITFESMYLSKKYSENKDKNLDVSLYAVNFPEDESIIPEYLNRLPHLKNSVNKDYPTLTHRKLPFLQEIFDIIKENIDADYYIYTNSDITLRDTFYLKVKYFIKNYKLESLIINRRDNIPKFINNIRLTKEHLNIITTLEGETHPGRDCFVMSKRVFHEINMKKIFIGCPPWGRILMEYLGKISKRIKILRNEYITFHIGCDNNHKNSKKTPLTKLNFFLGKDIVFDKLE